MNIVALLTGRGNNTLKDKNVLPICGKPLLYYPAIAAKNSNFINNYYVSSNDRKILRHAKNLGYTPIIRPDELARPDSQHIDCIIHALDIMKEENIVPDILIVLLANNVTIKTKWIDECIESILNDNTITAAVPVYREADHHPYRAKRINAQGMMESFVDIKDKNISTNRQDLEECYFLSHNFWVLNVKKSILTINGQPPWSFMGEKVKPYIIDESIDIHNGQDLYLAEDWVKKNWYI